MNQRDMHKHLSQTQAQPPHGHVPQKGGSGGGLPWGKILIGCGCLSLIGIAVAVGLGFFVYSAGSDWVEEQKKAVGVPDLPTTDGDETGSAGSDQVASADAKQDFIKKKEQALDPAKIRGYLARPLTKTDIREYTEFVEEWQDDPAYENYVEQWKAMEEMGKKKDDSTIGKLQQVRQLGKSMTAVRDVIEAYDAHVKEHGGYQKHYGRMMRIGGAVAAADLIAKDHKIKDADSDRVAKLILKDRPKIKAEYEKNIAEARKAAKEAQRRKAAGKDPQDMAGMHAMLAVGQGGPGLIALARMPEASFQTWEDLSESERKELRETLKTGVAPGPWFMFTNVNAAQVIGLAYVAELEEFQKTE